MGGHLPTDIRSFVAADTETTGKRPWKDDRLIEVAFVRFRDGNVVDRLVSLVNPQRPIPARLTAYLHGISDAMVSRAPLFGKLFPKIVRFIGDDPLVFHRAGFDLMFLVMEARIAGKTWPEFRVYCTYENAVASGMFTGFKLEELAGAIGARTDGVHRAERDAILVGQLFLYLLGRRVTLKMW